MSAPELLEWCTGLLACHSWNRTVTKGCGVLSPSGLCGFLKAGESWFLFQAFEAGMRGRLCQSLTVTIPSAISPLWVSPCPKPSFMSLTHSAHPARSCHPVLVPGGSHVQPQHLRHVGSISKRLCWTLAALGSLSCWSTRDARCLLQLEARI